MNDWEEQVRECAGEIRVVTASEISSASTERLPEEAIVEDDKGFSTKILAE